jgi:hypothetical protein
MAESGGRPPSALELVNQRPSIVDPRSAILAADPVWVFGSAELPPAALRENPIAGESLNGNRTG